MRTDHPTRSSNRFGRWSIPVLCVLLAIQIATSFGAGSRNDLSWFDPIVDVRQMVLDDFVGDTDPDRMQEAAISGMLETLDDPYTVWIPPRMEGEFDKQMRGSYVGIGAEISAMVAESDAFDFLDAPIIRLGGAETPIPYNPDLEKAVVPQIPDILDAARGLAQGRL